jgi:hypothetical protein
MKIRLVYLLFLTILCAIVLPASKNGRASQDKTGNTGAPGDEANPNGTPRICSHCHFGAAAPEVSVRVLDGNGDTVTTYIPGQQYVARVAINTNVATLTGFGFQMIALRDNGNVDLDGFSDPGNNTVNNYKIASYPQWPHLRGARQRVGEQRPVQRRVDGAACRYRARYVLRRRKCREPQRLHERRRGRGRYPETDRTRRDLDFRPCGYAGPTDRLAQSGRAYGTSGSQFGSGRPVPVQGVRCIRPNHLANCATTRTGYYPAGIAGGSLGAGDVSVGSDGWGAGATW